jgi:hypothetical protein
MKVTFRPLTYNSSITAIITVEGRLTLNNITIVKLTFKSTDDEVRFLSMNLDEQKDYILCAIYSQTESLF